MAKKFDIADLSINCDEEGRTKVSVWCKCHTAAEIDTVIAWLKLARALMGRWEEIRNEQKSEG